MEDNREVSLLRIFMSSTDKFKHAPLYEVIVFAAKRNGLAGATVLKGVMGFGSSSVVYSLKFWEIQEKVPLVVEIIDCAEKVESFIEVIRPYFNKIRNGCFITIEKATVVLSKKGIVK